MVTVEVTPRRNRSIPFAIPVLEGREAATPGFQAALNRSSDQLNRQGFTGKTGQVASLDQGLLAVGIGPDLKITQFKKLAVGQRDFGPQTIEIWDIPLPPEIAGLMGHPFFMEHVVCFDYAGSFMQIE